MRMKCVSIWVAAALCVAPAAMLASPKAEEPGASPNETASCLERIQRDALSVKDNADQLEARLRAPFLNDWESDADLLEKVRAEVNEMNRLSFELRNSEAQASTWQRKVIDRIEPTAVNLADTTQDAIATLNENQGRVYATDLGGLADDIYKQASLIDETVGKFEKYIAASHEARQLKQTLGLKSNS